MKYTLPLAAVLLLSTTGAAHALFGDDEARRQIIDLRQDIDSRLETTSRGQLELANQNEQLRSEVARLRGQIELLSNEVEILKQRQRDFYIDLDNRLRQFETAAQGGHNPLAGGDSGAESASYEAALNLLKDGKHADALAAFTNLLTAHPQGSFSAGAHFWAGNAALQLKDINTASKHFSSVIEQWPNDNVAPDAMLGLANSQQAIGDAATAQRTLEALLQRYPHSNAAEVAKQRLAKR